MKLNKLATGLAFALALSAPLSAQTVVGSVDWVDRDSIVGWACYQNVANTQLGVDLWLFNTATSQWTYLDHTLANRERNDVGHSNLCGWGNDAFYHGFEYTIFPEAVLASQGTYQVYASAANQLLPGSGGTSISFAAAGLPTGGIWRTDYEDPNLRAVAMTSCIFPFKNANPIPGLNVDLDPRFLGCGATVLNPWEDYPGQISNPVWCVRNHRHDQNSWYWSQSNSATNAPTWPTSNYWVIAANNELAYSKIQTGPPNQSQPVNVGGLYSVSMEKNFFFLGIDNTDPAYQLPGTPYLSLGAQMGRGVAGPIAFIQPTGQDTYLEFEVKQIVETADDYHDVAAYVELMWGGYKRYIGISLSVPLLGARYHWNWNALESFWYPGGEFNIIGTERIANHCYLGAQAQLPVLSQATIGQTRQVSVPLRALLQCLETASIPNVPNYGGGYMGWDSPRPTDVPIAITGLHLALEQAAYQPNAVMQTRFTKPVLVNR